MLPGCPDAIQTLRTVIFWEGWDTSAKEKNNTSIIWDTIIVGAGQENYILF